MTLRPTTKTRLGTLLLTAVPVTALGLAIGAGAGVGLLACGLVALAAGAMLGAMLASATPAISEPDEAHRPHTFGVRALLSRAAHEARPDLAEVAVRVDVTPARLRTVGDPECLHRAVADLIAQAARRSPPGGVVTLAARSVHSGVRLEVVDEGGGDCQMGLSDVRRIVDRHGGALHAERARPRGCRVVVELPAG
jgi:signal transduction histidine kinase